MGRFAWILGALVFAAGCGGAQRDVQGPAPGTPFLATPAPAVPSPAVPAPAPASPEPAVPAPAPGPSAAATFEFLRPSGCGDAVRPPRKRKIRTCKAEERLEVRLEGREVVERRLAAVASRNPYPEELHRQWRYCPAGRIQALDARPDRFARYEDPEVGPCYVYRFLDPDRLAALAKKARLSKLDGLHPWIVDAIRRVVLGAAAKNVDVKVISGVRPYTQKVKWITKKVRKGGKVRTVKVKQVVRAKGLHAWGLAVDVNLSHRNDLESAVRAYLHDPKERAAWDLIASLGQECGLVWIGGGDPKEIFHFEWHPTLPPSPKGELFQEFSRLEATKGNPAIWEKLKRDPRRPSAFEHLRDPAGTSTAQLPSRQDAAHGQGGGVQALPAGLVRQDDDPGLP